MTSNVAPPQHSSEKSWGASRAYAGATARMSCVLTRVASSDCCASRTVVSVKWMRFSRRIQPRKRSGPSSRSRSRLPGGIGRSAS